MTTAFDAAVAFVVKIEGPEVNDPNDPGGMTNFGISARAFPDINIAALTLEKAAALYEHYYWQPICGDSLSASVALVVFDAAVSQGVHTASIILQQAVGVVQDSIIGPKTIAAAASMVQGTLVSEICARRAVRYAAGDMAHYGLGWMRRLFAVAAAAV